MGEIEIWNNFERLKTSIAHNTNTDLFTIIPVIQNVLLLKSNNFNLKKSGNNTQTSLIKINFKSKRSSNFANVKK